MMWHPIANIVCLTIIGFLLGFGGEWLRQRWPRIRAALRGDDKPSR